MKYELRHPEYLRTLGRNGSESYGCDQRWYRTKWQQMSGCGPTTASTILIYLHKAGRITLPREIEGEHQCLVLMEQIWHYVRPTARGVYLAEQFCGGIQKFAQAHGLPIRCEALSIRGDMERAEDRNLLRALFIKPLFKPQSVEQTDDFQIAIDFIAAGLDQDCPIAFLNLSSGDVKHVDDWHWMAIVSLVTDPEAGTAEIQLIDGPKTMKVDFRTWMQTTQLGGALAYMVPAQAASDVDADKADPASQCGAADASDVVGAVGAAGAADIADVANGPSQRAKAEDAAITTYAGGSEETTVSENSATPEDQKR